MEQKSFPMTNASFNLTQACNLKCSYCFTYGQTAKRMPLEIGKKGIDFLIRNAREADIDDLNGRERRVDVSFWGGEPLLEWKTIQDLVLYVKRQNITDVKVTFGGTTNGVLLTEEKFPFLDEHKLFFMISLDGTQETHDRYRKTASGSGSHAMIMRNVEKVMKKWPFYKVRLSPYAEGIHKFYEDVKYLIEHGFSNIMFSPVYESGWTEERWKIWETECYKVVDLLADYKRKGKEIQIEHFKTYTGIDNSRWPCGAGRFYVGFDIDGAIYPCHRFNKFTDTRDWKEKEVCIGHVDYGITNPEFRQKFIDFEPLNCEGCGFFLTTPCHGGCYAVNYDLTKNIQTAPPQLCRYVKMQKSVSEYYREKVGIERRNMKQRGCVCYNMCYLENTEQEVKDIDGTGRQCQCYNANYSGQLDEKLANPIQTKVVTPRQVMDLLTRLERRIAKVEEYIMVKEGKK